MRPGQEIPRCRRSIGAAEGAKQSKAKQSEIAPHFLFVCYRGKIGVKSPPFPLCSDKESKSGLNHLHFLFFWLKRVSLFREKWFLHQSSPVTHQPRNCSSGGNLFGIFPYFLHFFSLSPLLKFTSQCQRQENPRCPDPSNPGNAPSSGRWCGCSALRVWCSAGSTDLDHPKKK